MYELSELPAINAKRLMADLATLRSFGAVGTGVVRPALCAIDIESRRWLRRTMAGAGLIASIDAVGNVIGRSANPGPALLIGSHSDTQPEGGWLDGALGVIYAIEIARTLAEDARYAHLAIDVASWIDEEARFVQYLGSRFFLRQVPQSEIDDAIDSDGVRLAPALAGLAPDVDPDPGFDPQRHAGFFEAHIEQGGVLESTGRRLGIVTSIVGAREFAIAFSGESNHAGTTPMRLRKDAAMALYATALSVDAHFRAAAGADTVWNVNDVTISPRSASIVASDASATLQFRDTDADRLDALAAAVPGIVAAVAAERGVAVARCEQIFTIEPAPMDPTLCDLIETAAERRLPGGSMRMPSGAGHDAQIFSSLIPTAMLFIPSIGGISHSFLEDTLEADIVLGCQVAADAVVAMLGHLRDDETQARPSREPEMHA